ncbi:hypothetical protein [Domibacillus indicus]|uniref:hypothetical protein n=1 Tax=Domibacillus indicus TaxID=1437523 RepID=UPI000618275A|nr:hypothetical protein [Domibacillus indicus]
MDSHEEKLIEQGREQGIKVFELLIQGQSAEDVAKQMGLPLEKIERVKKIAEKFVQKDTKK